jgi:hypothetical protein
MFALAGLVGALVAVPIAVYASHSFSDVPDSNTFHEDIAWLKDSGVTLGCNPPANTLFCPKDNVTREQMAAFMRRLAENQVVDAATAVQADSATTANSATTASQADDSDQLDGFDAQGLAPRASFNSTADAPDNNFTLETEIIAPAPGILVISGGTDAYSNTLFDSFFCQLEVNGTLVEGSLRNVMENPDVTTNYQEDCNTSGAVVVDADAYKVSFRTLDVDAAGFFATSVSVIWVPFDGGGNTPTP